ncbi:spore coat protein [Paenibacillus thailandensis]|uniref:Spore coat protein n=1 Tax=Paenibacillus thailandensis TaxID=393250 RepID=A0ABW5QUL9_9BACL
MAAHLGAHETVETHEILMSAINAINTMQLYRPYAKDSRLVQILDKQLQFAVNEYNFLVQTLQNVNAQGRPQSAPYSAAGGFTPIYGLDNPAMESPNLTAKQMDDRDVATGLLCLHKASAMMKMTASLECANRELRSAMQQGAVNCSEQAYEVWQYMNQAGHYQVPTMKEMTTNTIIGHFQTAGQPAAQPNAFPAPSPTGFNMQ